MINIFKADSNVSKHSQSCYLLGSRPLSHVAFWLIYYLAFSFIWVKADTGLYASFYLEFVLLPPRIMAVYAMIYWLLPNFLLQRKFQQFILSYAALLIIAGSLQRTFDHYFYQQLLLNKNGNLLDFSNLVRNIVLVNSTIIFVAALKVLQLYFIEREQVTKLRTTINDNELKVSDSVLVLKSNRRIHHVKASHILYIESMGNYVNYFLISGEKIVVYCSLKASLEALSDNFIRLQRSYVINTQYIQSYNHENVVINGNTLPRGPDVLNKQLQPPTI